MQLTQLLADDDAVSTVVAVVLMVAITVVISAVIATFALGLGQQVEETSPNAAFSFDLNAEKDHTTITMEGGNELEATAVYVKSTKPFRNGSSDPWPSDSSSATWADITGSKSPVTAGANATINASPADETFVGETIRVVWQAPETDRTTVLREFAVTS